MTSCKRTRKRDSNCPGASDIGLYGVDLSCLDWVEDVVIQQLIQELGLNRNRELPELKQILTFQSTDDLSKPVSLEMGKF